MSCSSAKLLHITVETSTLPNISPSQEIMMINNENLETNGTTLPPIGTIKHLDFTPDNSVSSYSQVVVLLLCKVNITCLR